MAFHVGQKVVAVGFPSEESKRLITEPVARSQPEIGDVVTIRAINDWPDVTLIRLVEHDNSHLIGYRGSTTEPGWDARCFRPLQHGKTDISIFTRMLPPTPSKTRERERA